MPRPRCSKAYFDSADAISVGRDDAATELTERVRKPRPTT